jgi:membrane fusion protein, multidrug efflux system
MLYKISSMRQITYVFIFFLVVSSASGCGKGRQKEISDIIPVKVIRIMPQDIKNILSYTGDVKAQDEAVIYPKVNGKVLEKLKEDGSRVSKGDIIAYIDRDEVGFEFNKAPVESPLSGIIGRVYVDKGASVSPQTPVALVVDMDKVKIELDIPGKYLPQIKLGQLAEVNVDAYPKDIFIGKVTKISPVVDTDTRTTPIEIMIDNPDYYFRPGMFARVGLVLQEKKAVPIVLKEAILGKAPDLYVYAIRDDIAYKRNVELGIRQGAYFEIITGLEQGDLVVIMGQQRLYDGVKVRVEESKE